MKMFQTGKWLFLIGLVSVLAACGGGGGGGSDKPPQDQGGNTTGTITGFVTDFKTGKPVSGAAISSGTTQVFTNSSGIYKARVAATDRQTVGVNASNYAFNQKIAAVFQGKTSIVDIKLLPVAYTTTIDPSQNQSVADPNSPAQVALTANSLSKSSGEAPAGTVTVNLTPIDPSIDPGLMPGDFTSLSSGTEQNIESFGAMDITFVDSSGNPLNLKSGQKATIRIPAKVAAQGGSLSSTMPMWSYDTITGRWINEGTLTLGGTAPNQYYEGEVGHFSSWNCDRIYDTATISGKVVDADCNPIQGARVTSKGLDYIGTADTYTKADGTFTVKAKANANVAIYASSSNGKSNVLTASTGANGSNTLLSSNLAIGTGGACGNNPQTCNSVQVAGGDTPETRTMDLGQSSGTFTFNYETFNQQDQIVVTYEGRTLFDTGCVGTAGTRTTTLSYSGASTGITVEVKPNCAGGTGTAWEFNVGCPTLGMGTPSVPTASATPGNNQVTISWSAVTGASSYNVYRSTTSGITTTSTKIASNVTGTSYIDTTAAAGITYYYAVTAVISNVESNLSNVVSATVGGGTYSISGNISDPTSVPVSGVTVALSGASTASTATDSSGNYSFTSLANGSYTVTPSMTGYTFNPANTAVTVSGADMPGQNFIGNATSSAIGTLSGYIKDAVTNAGLSGVNINVYNGSNLVTTLMTDSLGVYTTTLSAGTYSATVTKTGYLTANLSNITIQANVTNTLETVLQVSTTYSGVGTISGTIKDAFTGLGISGVTLNFRSGINANTGTIMATTTTGSGGTYTVTTLTGGNYTGEASISGYTTGFFTVTVIGGQTKTNQDATLTPTLASGETRIVLTWGATPSDLDSHLTGPVSGSATRFHVYYSDQGSSTASPYANLDVDDTSSYGPETTTIYQQTTGTYRFSVHDYSNAYSTSSAALSSSGAQIKVYSGGSLAATFNVPVNQGGTLWTVFELSGNTITPINTMSYVSDETAVLSPSLPGKTRPVSHSDAPLMRGLPKK